MLQVKISIVLHCWINQVRLRKFCKSWSLNKEKLHSLINLQIFDDCKSCIFISKVCWFNFRSGTRFFAYYSRHISMILALSVLNIFRKSMTSIPRSDRSAGVYSAPKTTTHEVTQSCGLVMSTGSGGASENLQPSYRSSEALTSSHRSAGTRKPNLRRSKSAKPTFRTSYTLQVQPTNRSTKNIMPTFRSTRTVQPTYASTTTVQPTYYGMTTVQPTYTSEMTMHPTYNSLSLPRRSFDLQNQEDFSVGFNGAWTRSPGMTQGRSLLRGGELRFWLKM